MPSARRLALVLAFVSLASNLRAEPLPANLTTFLKTYCFECHNEKKASGELDLTRANLTVTAEYRTWELVVGYLKNEEMPPAKAKQPSAALLAEAVAMLEKLLRAESGKLAGDPGVVPPRRLTNAEFDYTVRDITGADIRPAKSFPVDPASGEGFNNTGEALTMSPGLFKKYYAAAEFVADHALLATDGLKFAPHPVVTFADRQKFYEQAILRFYETHAVDYEKYLFELWQYKHRIESKRSETVEAWAAERKISPKYARSLWNALEGKSDDVHFLAWLRGRWNDLPADANASRDGIRKLAADVAKLARELGPKEFPAIVADAGNGPINHLDRRA